MEDEAFDKALSDAADHPVRALLDMARAGDRVPLADYLERGARFLRLLEERRRLSADERRKHIREHPRLEARASRFLQMLADHELLTDLSKRVREQKLSDVGWLSSKSRRRAKLDAWAEVRKRIDESDGQTTNENAICEVATDPEVLRRLGLEPDTAYERIRAWFYEGENEERAMRRDARLNGVGKKSG